nr:MAG TPA: hypothetical protein [Caudoviricetes sp.]
MSENTSLNLWSIRLTSHNQPFYSWGDFLYDSKSFFKSRTSRL